VILALIGICFAETKTASQYAAELGFKTFDHEFNTFKINHNRHYSTPEEEEQRKLNFLNSLQIVEKHNELYKKGEKSYELGINLFSDLSADEYKAMFRMPNPTVRKPEPAPAFIANLTVAAPQSFDWRQHGKVTPVKSQGDCGSCWSFSVTGAIESLYAIKHNQNLDLSEEQLIDCMNSKCDGEWIYDGYKYVIANGLETESAYPYTAGSGKYNACKEKKSSPHTHISSYKSLGKGISEAHPLATDAEIMAAVQIQPVSVMFNADGDDFGSYKSGVITTNNMGWEGSHAVIIVGWGTENGKDYWLIKNSWGAEWGDAGYFKMVRGQNLRHVNEYLYFPVL